MKRSLLSFLCFLSVCAVAQQQTYEFFNWKSGNIPFPMFESYYDTDGFPAYNIDSKGRAWYTEYYGAPKGTILLKRDTTKIQISASSKEKAGGNYNYNLSSIDERDTKWGIAEGYVSNTAQPRDYYVFRYDSLGQSSIIYPKDLGDSDTLGTWDWNKVTAVGGKMLIATLNKFIWDSNPVKHIPFSTLGMTYPQLYHTKKGVIYAISNNSSQISVVSFYSDGTYERRLADKRILNSYYHQSTGILTVYTSDGAYDLNGKTITLQSIPNSAPIFRSGSLTKRSFQLQGLSLEVLFTSKGFIVKEGNQYANTLFASNASIVYDSLFLPDGYYDQTAKLQEDSTLVIRYNGPVTNTENRSYLFTYKKGTIALHKVYDWMKLGIPYHRTGAFYVGKTTYFYCNDGSKIYQIKGDTTKSDVSIALPADNSCPSYFSVWQLKAFKDFFWVLNSDSLTDCAIARMRHDQYFVNGKVYYDANSDGYRASNEYPYSKIKLRALPSGLLLQPDNEGNFAFTGEQGKSYRIEVVDSTRFASIKKSHDSYDLGVKLKEEKPEVNTSFWLPWARCNTNRSASLWLSNSGVLNVEKVRIRLVPNEKMKLIQNGLPVDTAELVFNNLAVRQSTSMNYHIEWPDADFTGQTASLTAITDLYVAGVIASTKIDSIQTVIRCSYDPNDKSVTPVGIGNQHYTLKKNALQYQIRFENTGNDTAYHVVVYDTLSTHLDVTTLEVLGTSHKMNAEVSAAGVAAFHFNYIYLPDSTTNKERAQGYVRFSILPKTGLADNVDICNRAGIVFDQNKPIVTNTVCNTLVDRLPVITSLEQKHLTEQRLYPNPATTWVQLPEAESAVIYSLSGKEVLRGKGKRLDVSVLENGIYLVQLHDGNAVTTLKLAIQK